MPKQKSHRGAAKRFRMTAGGKAKRSQAFKRHILTKKTRKRKRHLDQEVAVHPADLAKIRKMLPYG
jgi:large subunit ribosomal protein L35